MASNMQKIADFFASISLKLDGASELTKLANDLNKAAKGADKLSKSMGKVRKSMEGMIDLRRSLGDLTMLTMDKAERAEERKARNLRATEKRLAKQLDIDKEKLKADNKLAVAQERTNMVTKRYDRSETYLEKQTRAAAGLGDLRNKHRMAEEDNKAKNRMDLAVFRENARRQREAERDRKKQGIKADAALLLILKVLKDISINIREKLINTVVNASAYNTGLRNTATTFGFDRGMLQTFDTLADATNTNREALISFATTLKNTKEDLKRGVADMNQLGAWNILGITPEMSESQVLAHLQARLATGDVQNTRRWANQAGISDDVIKMLMEMNRRGLTQESFAKINLKPSDMQALDKFAASWSLFARYWDMFVNRFGAAFARILSPALDMLTYVIDKLISLFDWMPEGSKYVIGLVMAFTTLVATLASVAASLGIVLKLMRLLGIQGLGSTILGGAMSGLGGTATALGGVISTIGSLLAASLPLIIGAALVTGVTLGLKKLGDLQHNDLADANDEASSENYFRTHGVGRFVGNVLSGGELNRMLAERDKERANLTFNIDGSVDPKETAKAVKKVLDDHYQVTDSNTGAVQGAY